MMTRMRSNEISHTLLFEMSIPRSLRKVVWKADKHTQVSILVTIILHTKNQNICLLKGFYKSVHGSFTHNGIYLETTQMSINRRMNKQIVVYSGKEYFSAIESKSHVVTHKNTWKHFENIMLKKRNQTPKSTWFMTPSI